MTHCFSYPFDWEKKGQVLTYPLKTKLLDLKKFDRFIYYLRNWNHLLCNHDDIDNKMIQRYSYIQHQGGNFSFLSNIHWYLWKLKE
jgi:hypothetical protein